ncbi:MAG TPA: hypothetical protein VKA84_07330, partial [Gemmatimonadaceae bacterium]|nr:hypothetical protein [Gemmatimonadaceae bacterium]
DGQDGEQDRCSGRPPGAPILFTILSIPSHFILSKPLPALQTDPPLSGVDCLTYLSVPANFRDLYRSTTANKLL